MSYFYAPPPRCGGGADAGHDQHTCPCPCPGTCTWASINPGCTRIRIYTGPVHPGGPPTDPPLAGRRDPALLRACRSRASGAPRRAADRAWKPSPYQPPLAVGRRGFLGPHARRWCTSSRAVAPCTVHRVPKFSGFCHFGHFGQNPC